MTFPCVVSNIVTSSWIRLLMISAFARPSLFVISIRSVLPSFLGVGFNRWLWKMNKPASFFFLKFIGTTTNLYTLFYLRMSLMLLFLLWDRKDDVHIPSSTYSCGWLSIRSLWVAEKKVKLWAVILCCGARLNQLPLCLKIHKQWLERVGGFLFLSFKLLMEWPRCFSLRWF